MDPEGASESFPVALCCPVDQSPLRREAPTWLSCPKGHRYPVVEGIPVLLRADMAPTIWLMQKSWELANEYARDPRAIDDPLFLDTVGVSPSEREAARELAAAPNASEQTDPVVSVVIAATSGYLYRHLIGVLDAYPIPELRLPRVDGAKLLDIGCNWGRWSIAAARKGYDAVGIDPSLGAVLAARRLSRRLGLANHYVCGDARYLPFGAAQFDQVFSYSVIQHFSKPDANRTFDEAARVLSDEGGCLIQMAHAIGLRSVHHQARRGFREAREFEVRYWTMRELHEAFESRFENHDISVHCYFGLGLEPSDMALVRPAGRLAIRASEMLRKLSKPLPAMKFVADSLYVQAARPRRTPPVRGRR